MLDKATLINIQSNKKSVLNFGPGANTLIGESDRGKSAALRGINWPITNRPSGDSLVSDWADTASSTIKFLNDPGWVEVERLKEGKKNYYVLKVNNGRKTHTSEFTAFKLNIPDEISQALNIGDVNIQEQMDMPFLFSLRAAEVARYLNRIVKLEVIDTSISYVLGKITSINQAIKFEEAEVDGRKEKLKAFEHLPEFKKNVETLEAKANELHRKTAQRISIQTKLDTIKEHEATISGLNVILRTENQLIIAEQKIKLLQEKEDEANRIEDALEKLNRHNNDIEAADKIISKNSSLKKVKELLAQITLLQNKRDRIKIQLEQLKTFEEQVEGTKKLLTGLESELKKILPKVCPFYNQPCPLSKKK